MAREEAERLKEGWMKAIRRTLTSENRLGPQPFLQSGADGQRQTIDRYIQKEMEQMNLKLVNVFSDMLWKSGQVIITAILKDERSRYLQAMVAAAAVGSFVQPFENKIVAFV